jgi:hypothetical protein
VPALIGSRHELLRRVDRVLAIGDRARRRVSLAGATTAVGAIVMLSAQLNTMRGFSELVEIVFPQVSRPAIAIQRAPVTARLTPDTTDDHATDARATDGRAPEALNAPSVLIAPDASNAPDAPVASAFALDAQIASADKPVAFDLSAREFPGAYSLPGAPVNASTERSNPWQALATPGVEIASSARKISMGVAGVFTRAGVSLARSF